jgi:hypothetical protein
LLETGLFIGSYPPVLCRQSLNWQLWAGGSADASCGPLRNAKLS